MSPDLARSTLEIAPAGADLSGWDPLVEASPDSTVEHLSAWREVMEDGLGARCEYLRATDEEGVLRGILPLVQVRSRLFGHYWVSMPFLNRGGPLGEPLARVRLAQGAARLAARAGADLLEIRTRAPLDAGLPTTSRKVSVHLALPGSAEALWTETLRAKLRSQIRKPQKEGMEVRSGPAELPAFYDVYARNMRDLGTPVLPRAFFERIEHALPTQAVIVAVYAGEVAVAAGFGLHWRSELEITWASSLREWSRSAPNMLLYFAMMGEAIRRGATRFDFGRCTPGGSTHRFKQQWGGEDVPLPWVHWSPGTRSTPPPPQGGIYRAGVAVWRRLPLALTNRVGPVLARSIP